MISLWKWDQELKDCVIWYLKFPYEYYPWLLSTVSWMSLSYWRLINQPVAYLSNFPPVTTSKLFFLGSNCELFRFAAHTFLPELRVHLFYITIFFNQVLWNNFCYCVISSCSMSPYYFVCFYISTCGLSSI